MRVWNGKQMYTASEMYRITGTDPKTQALRVYERDKWKLLTPTDTTGSGVRLYDDNAMMRFVIIWLCSYDLVFCNSQQDYPDMQPLRL